LDSILDWEAAVLLLAAAVDHRVAVADPVEVEVEVEVGRSRRSPSKLAVWRWSRSLRLLPRAVAHPH
jgi:hypothetical protein